MTQTSHLRPERRFAGVALFALALVPATVLAFIVPVSQGLTFSGLAITPVVTVHIMLASAWVVMLAAQAWLARSGRIALHRTIGRTSYALAPAVFVTFMLVFFELMGRRPYPFDALSYRFDVYNVLNPLAFLLCWALAIRHRKRTQLHMRYMISTMFAIGSAIVFRILLHFFGWVPGFDSNAVLVVATGFILMAPLAWLIARERGEGFGVSPYWIPLIHNAVLVVGFFGFARTGAWKALIDWLARLSGIGS